MTMFGLWLLLGVPAAFVHVWAERQCDRGRSPWWGYKALSAASFLIGIPACCVLLVGGLVWMVVFG